ncbi:MAG TPA: hypothetical protein VHL53_17115 [Acidimicrobiia bacterium]|nr:hypothetical protein [Acidimicrobiia bacterium]
MSRSTPAERAAWEAAWSTPQAVAWEKLGWNRVVARYVRTMVAAEARGARAALLSEVRQLEDRLGLNPTAMARLRWEVAADELDEARQERPRVRLVQAVDPAMAAPDPPAEE